MTRFVSSPRRRGTRIRRIGLGILTFVFTWLLFVPVQADAPLTTGNAVAVLSPSKKQSSVTANILLELKRSHYRSGLRFNDALSSKLLDSYLEGLDPSRSFFLQSDVDRFDSFRHELDDAIKEGDLDPAFEIFNLFQERRIERNQHISSRLEDGIGKIDFTVDEKLELDRDKKPWLSSQSELEDLWRKQFKYDVLSLKLGEKTDEEITKVLSRRYENQLRRMRQTNTKDVFLTFMNTLTMSYDPHTQYFPPHESKNFDIRMSLSVEGIGALLQSDQDYTKIVRIIPGGPAEASDLLKAADRILAVGQDTEGEMVDIVGWRIDEVVDLIRGPKGSQVRLEILPAGISSRTESKLIQLTRDKVKLEEQEAQKKILTRKKNGKDYKVGVIELPAFYMDFKAAQAGDPNYKSGTRDVRKLIGELKKENVDALVLDLRNNGGGSLVEARELTGAFLRTGPVVQIRDSNGYLQILADEDKSIAWSGPFAVLVNRLSASASEIFAGAIQDYGRGIVLGGRTFGKGTVQNVRPLREGDIKLTLAKFYRVSGGSTQNRGITPDIPFPDIYDEDEIGESSLPEALKWDSVASLEVKKDNFIPSILPALRQLHDRRTKSDPEFQYILDRAEFSRKMREDNSISLNTEGLKAERAKTEEDALRIENKKRIGLGLEPVKKLADLEDPDAEKRDDPVVVESADILVDLMTLAK